MYATINVTACATKYYDPKNKPVQEQRNHNRKLWKDQLTEKPRVKYSEFQGVAGKLEELIHHRYTTGTVDIAIHILAVSYGLLNYFQ